MVKRKPFRVIVRTTDDRRHIFHSLTLARAKAKARKILASGFNKAVQGTTRFYPASGVRVVTVEAP